MKEEVILRILAQESPKLKLEFQTNGLWKLLGAKRSFQEGSRVFLKFWEWSEDLGAKNRAFVKSGNFLGIFGYLVWLGPNRKYFSETEGPVVNFPNVQRPQQNLEEA
jgi:hypothetical protein